MTDREWAWVVMLQPGLGEFVEQLYCPERRTFNVVALRDAAKAKFVHLLAHVDASQLSVSATRDGEMLEEDAIVNELADGTSRQHPLFIHAPAQPQGASLPTPW